VVGKEKPINHATIMFNVSTTHAAFINLDHRKDRLIHMEKELKRAGLTERFDITRLRGMLPAEYTGDRGKVVVMQARTPGAIGCHYSQVKVMQTALLNKQHAFVMEDDLVFCDDFITRLEYMGRFLNTHAWDVMWLGGTFHINPPYWHTGKNIDLLYSNSIGRDAELTDDPRILRTYGAFSTYAYIVNKDSIAKILTMLDSVVHKSMGIDWAFIKLQPDIFTYAFVPGSVKQMDNPSDIGKPDSHGRQAFTYFSGFSKLNHSVDKSRYWWAKRMEDFDPLKFDWKEAKI
jgi:GR25 family glycosyltransferase involved in LPS biosynthesis